MAEKRAVLFLTFLGFALRAHGLFANTFHADEALYASWAKLIARWRDPLLTSAVLDKPPLLFYLQALFFPVIGHSEAAARLPNVIASVLLIPLVWQMARTLGRRALLAALLVALSPFAIQFSATAFTDPLMTTLIVGGLLAAVRHRPFTSGLLFALALITKYQAILFLPLFVLLGWGKLPWRPWLAGGAFPLVALLLWEIGRAASPAHSAPPDFGGLYRAFVNFGGLRLAYSWELWPRLLGWLRLGWYLFGPGWLLVAGYWLLTSGRWSLATDRTASPQPPRSATSLLPFVLAYLLFHCLLAIPIWDRYLLPLIPLIPLLLAHPIPQPSFPIPLFILAALLLWPALNGRLGHYPIGSSPTADEGAAVIAQHLADAPYGTVLYDHWYSWHWRYQLFDSRVYVAWVPSPASLVEELTVFGADGRYIALPNSAVAQPMRRAVTQAGYTLQPVATANGMSLYQIQGEMSR